jgi:hypothetical protein
MAAAPAIVSVIGKIIAPPLISAIAAATRTGALIDVRKWQVASILATRDEIAIGRALATSPVIDKVTGYSSLILFS